MADDAATQNTQTETPAAEATSPRSSKIVPIAALGGGLLVGAALGLFLIGPRFAGAAAAAPADSAHASAPASAAEHGEGSEGGEATPSPVHVIDNLILNPAGSGGARFLMVTTAVELSTDALLSELKGRDVEARDIVLRVLGSKTVEELSEMSNRDQLKNQVRDSLSVLFAGSLRPTAIRRIFFPHFVIQ